MERRLAPQEKPKADSISRKRREEFGEGPGDVLIAFILKEGRECSIKKKLLKGKGRGGHFL